MTGDLPSEEDVATDWPELTLVDRLARTVEMVGGAEALAEAAEVSRSTVYRWLKGEAEPTALNRRRIEGKVGLPAGALVRGLEETQRPGPRPPPAPQVVEVPAFEPVSPERDGWAEGAAVDRFYFAAEAVRRLSPAGPLVAIRTVGNVLQPQLPDGDWAIVDTGERRIVSGRLYALTLEGRLLLRRVLDEPAGLWCWRATTCSRR